MFIDVSTINYIPCKVRYRDGRNPGLSGNFEGERRCVADYQTNVVGSYEAEFSRNYVLGAVVDRSARRQGLAEIHTQTIALDDTSVERLAAILDWCRDIVKQPFRRCCADMNALLWTCVCEGANHLMRSHRMAVAMTGDVIEN